MRHPETDDEFRREVCDWLRANGLNPATVCRDPQASISDGRLTLLCKVQRNGRDVVNVDGFAVLTETITVPVVVPPSPDIAEWLRPRCTTCGR